MPLAVAMFMVKSFIIFSIDGCRTGDFVSQITAGCTANEPFLRIVTKWPFVIDKRYIQKTVHYI